MTTAESEVSQEPTLVAQYQISFPRLAQLNRSAVTLVAGRRPAACPSLQKPDQELPEVAKLVSEIARYSKNDEEYIKTEMPIQEIVFRILLRQRNRPTYLSDIHYELTEKWATPVRPITMSEDTLGRILDADTYYGFVRKEAEPKKSKS